MSEMSIVHFREVIASYLKLLKNDWRTARDQLQVPSLEAKLSIYHSERVNGNFTAKNAIQNTGAQTRKIKLFEIISEVHNVCQNFVSHSTWFCALAAIPNVYGCVGCLWWRRTPVTSVDALVNTEFRLSAEWSSMAQWLPILQENDSLKWPLDPSFRVPSLFWNVNMIATSTSSSPLFSTSQINTAAGRLVS